MDAANNYLGIGMYWNAGIPCLGRAMSVVCPVCGVNAGDRCVEPAFHDTILTYRASHVERGRVARYAIMGVPPITPEEKAT